MAVSLTGQVTQRDAHELWPVYDAVFGDHPSYDVWCEAVWDRHTARAGFRLARARGSDGRLVGFAYGYTGERGQWWTDRVARVLRPDVAEEWLGGHFELVSIGVLEDCRGRGVGRRLMTALTGGLPHDRWLLMTTADRSDPARRLYASLGWQVLGPGPRDDQVVLGARRDG